MSRLVKTNVICGDKVVDGKGTLVCDLLSDGNQFIKVEELSGTNGIGGKTRKIQRVKDFEVVRGDGSTTMYYLLDLEKYDGNSVVVVSFTETDKQIDNTTVHGVDVGVGIITAENMRTEYGGSERVYACLGLFNNQNTHTIPIWFDDGTMMEFKCYVTSGEIYTSHAFLSDVGISE